MKCQEFQQVLPDIIDGGQTVEQEAHWRSCPECSSLVSDLHAISQEARMLRGYEEPSPRVWNSIEIALREEGLIRQPQHGLAVVSSPGRRWSMAWLVPLAATFLITFGVIDYYNASKGQPLGKLSTASTQIASNTTAASNVDPTDQQVLEEIASRAPAMRATYEANLQAVNAYIQDAEASAKNDPNDEEAQQSLVEAYAQKNMVYEMALDRSLR